MSHNDRKQNFRLSSHFVDFTVKHPEIFDALPQNTQIVFGDVRNPQLTRRNILMARRLRGKVYQAIRDRRGSWHLVPIR
jgi:hypothetical protein